MGYSIPVIYLTCSHSELPAPLSRWSDANALFDLAYADRQSYCFHTATARNWWQLLAVAQVRDREQLPGLGFCELEVAALQGRDLDPAIESLTRVIAALSEAGTIDESTIRLPDEELDINCEVAGGLEKFLHSLLQVMRLARDEGKVFLFVQPQP